MVGRIYGAIFVVFLMAFAVGRCHASTYDHYAAEQELKNGLEAGLLQSICKVESHWRPQAKGYHGEIGICQIKPSTVKMICSSCLERTEYIHQGQKSEEVRKVQQALKQKGFDPGTIDGVFGLRTHLAVTMFQTSVKLTPDGIVGPHTWKSLIGYELPKERLQRQLLDPYKNIEYAAMYLVWLREYLRTEDRDILAAAYNGGPANPTVVYMLKVRRVTTDNTSERSMFKALAPPARRLGTE